uniref:Phosducin/Thioredoxin, putative n=1 Tax=Theileria annulata TaxID=5874 RepID=A0A3B0N493_THEAN
MTIHTDRLRTANKSYLMDVAKRKYLEKKSDLISEDKNTDENYTKDKDWRVDRLEMLRKIHEKRREYLDRGSGNLEILTDEKELINIANSNTRVLCHFYEDDFERCKLLDSLLVSLASRFLDTRFVKIKATKAPFFTHKIGIKVLPTLLATIDGNVTRIYIGFEEFGDIFNSVSNGNNRIPLKIALNKLNAFFNSTKNPYKKYMCKDSIDDNITTEEFMDQFYSRHIDKKHGVRSQILMVGGPKSIRGNPGGIMNSMLSFPQITSYQFVGIAKDMECMFLEKILQCSQSSKLTRSYNTSEFTKVQKMKSKEIVKELNSKVQSSDHLE